MTGLRTSTPAPATAPASACTSPEERGRPDKKLSLSPSKTAVTTKSVENFCKDRAVIPDDDNSR